MVRPKADGWTPWTARATPSSGDDVRQRRARRARAAGVGEDAGNIGTVGSLSDAPTNEYLLSGSEWHSILKKRVVFPAKNRKGEVMITPAKKTGTLFK